MNKILIYFRTSLIVTILLMPVLFFTVGFASEVTTFQSQTSISTLKSWTVTLNDEIDSTSISSNSVIIKDSKGTIINTTITLGEDKKSLIIDPPIDGFIPNQNYYITINENLKSATGQALSKSVTMQFTTINKYEDTSSFSELPQIKNLKILEQPLVKNDSLRIELTSNTDSFVQYRIFLYEYPNGFFDSTYKYGNVKYTELTNGFTSPVQGSIPYIFSSTKNLITGKYRILAYVKKANVQGMHSSIYTDYDNFYTDYVRVLEKNFMENSSINETYTYVNSNKTLSEAVNIQYTKGAPNHDEASSLWVPVTPHIISYYMNPYNFLDDYGKYMFLDLHYMEGVLPEDLNKALLGKGILEGIGQEFINAGKKNNINPIYLVSHSLLETSNGTSSLSNGVLVSQVDGQAVEPKIVYNLFGVNAKNADAIKYGSEYAYKKGWFSIEEALSGGAYYIGSSYINNTLYNRNTLYKIRWFTENDWAYPQYSTDIAWAYKQIINMKTLFDKIDSGNPVFQIPVYK